MVKKSKQVQEVEEIDESYYSQSSDGEDDKGSDGMRVIDTANMGNYASDSGSEESDTMLANIQS